MVKEILRKMRRLATGTKLLLLRFVAFSKPIDERLVVFDNFNGKGYGCNPKYIAEELGDSPLRLVWITSNPNERFPVYIEAVKNGSAKALVALSTARVRVTNVRNYKGLPKREGQYYIQTWHAMMALKCVEAEAEDYLSTEYLRHAKIDGQETDLMIANNDVDEKRYKGSFWYDGEVLRCGLPRLKPIVDPDPARGERVKRDLGLDRRSKIVLYAPTFRDYDYSYVPPFDAKVVVEACQRAFGGSFECLMRLHPVMSANAEARLGGVDVSGWEDVQEILAIADVLVTDYSSICFDFAVGGNPVFLYAPDYDDYVEKSRPLFLDMDDLPIPVCSTMEELAGEICSADEEERRTRFESFFASIGLTEDGDGARKVAQVILGECGVE